MNPHLTLTLSPPIGWERRGNRRRTGWWTGWWTGEIYFALPSCGGQGILLKYSRIESLNRTRNLNLFHEPSPHPDPLPSHRMGAEREQEKDRMVDGMVDRRNYFALPSCGGQGILLKYSRIESLNRTRNLNLFHEPSPHPDPLPSHRMGAEREQEKDTHCFTDVLGAAAGSWSRCRLRGE
jgi:hypothetical protein